MTDKTKRQSKAESLRAAITAIATAPAIDAAPANQSEPIAESPMPPAATQATSVVIQPESISPSAPVLYPVTLLRIYTI